MTHKPLFLALMLTVVVASGVSARTPTNAGRAFKTFDLYQRSAFGGTVDHTSFNPYPASLVGPSLLVMRPTPGSADTMGIFNSQAKDAIYFEVNGTQSQSFSTYTVSPPQYATSIGTLLMGVNIYNGSGNFADLGKQLATATVTFVDGDTAIARLNVGSFVRDYFDSGPYTCVSNQAIYATRPTDARSAFLYETGGDYFDARESLLPKLKRVKKVASIRVEGTLLDHFCSSFNPHVYAGSRLSGFSLWPNFHVVNTSSQPVARLFQTTGHDHGGYQIGATVYGSRRKTDVTACQVTSMAMCYTFAGFPTTVDQLNTYLQQHQGYQPEPGEVVSRVVLKKEVA